MKFIRVTSTSIRQNAKSAETSFLKESIENADFYKPVLNKIRITSHMRTTRKYNFVAALKTVILLVEFTLFFFLKIILDQTRKAFNTKFGPQ